MDNRQIRYLNARLLIVTRHGGNLSEFAAKLGKLQPQVSAFAPQDPKSATKGIGGKIAKEIEAKYETGPGWMDHAHPDEWATAGLLGDTPVSVRKPSPPPASLPSLADMVNSAMEGMTATQVVQWLAMAEQIKAGHYAARDDVPPDTGNAWAQAVQAAEAGVYQILAEAGVEESLAPQVSARILAFMERRIHNQGAPPGQSDRRQSKS